MRLVPGLNLQGGDLRGVRATSVRECVHLCLREPECVAFTFIVHQDPRFRPCWLKRQGFTKEPSNATVSGFIPHRIPLWAVEDNEHEAAMRWLRQGHAASCGGDVNVVYVARGAVSPLEPLLAMAQARLWSASPDRLCFHLLADGAALDALSSDGMARWALLSGWKLQELSQLQVVNASDARLAERVSRVGRRFLRSSLYTLRSKARKFTVAKLFLHHLLRDVDCALVLDSDIFVMADLCELWDLFENQLLSRPACLLGYAFEQQNEYRLWNKEASLPFRSLSEAQTPHAQGYNGGVALLALKRMRRHQEYEVTLARVLNFASTAYGACTPRAILRDICFRLMCNLKQLGDQTVLSLAARLNRQWHKHVWVIPCKWNWQTSLAFYTLGNQHRMTPACHRQVAPVLKTDSICPDPPLLLHFNYPTLLKDAHFHEFSLLKRGPEDYLRNEAILSRIFNQNVIVQRCNFSDYWVKISHRGCNSSFLLTRLREASQGGESPPPALLTRLREVASQRGGSLPLLPRAPLAGRRRPAPPPRSSKMQKICDPHPVGGRVLCGPALIMVGMAKCGTNAILTYLSRHPNVRVTGVKPVARSAPGGGIDLSQLDPAEFISKFGRGVAPADPNVWVINWFALEDDLKALRQSECCELLRMLDAWPPWTSCLPERTVDECASYPEIEPLGP
ncbi:hypothetical protein AB1Y20_015919 [Prymnesium parvum]|uniref:Apple domain-containing protein n=1 Tax=Prymnesium parvum TaxID=97485 RepID=A0AB34K248_PRYPA